MNYYAQAIEACSKEQDWKAIAFNVAKKHPKIFLDAINGAEWEVSARQLYLIQGDKIEAIKYCRRMTGLGLKEAKEAVEGLT